MVLEEHSSKNQDTRCSRSHMHSNISTPRMCHFCPERCTKLVTLANVFNNMLALNGCTAPAFFIFGTRSSTYIYIYIYGACCRSPTAGLSGEVRQNDPHSLSTKSIVGKFCHDRISISEIVEPMLPESFRVIGAGEHFQLNNDVATPVVHECQHLAHRRTSLKTCVSLYECKSQKNL